MKFATEFLNGEMMKGLMQLILLTSLSSLVFAGPPFITEDPEILDSQHSNLYLFETSAQTRTLTNLALPALELDYGLMKNVEVDFVFPIIWSTPYDGESPKAVGIGDLQTTLKLRLLPESRYFPTVAFVPVYVAPLGSSRRRLGNGRSWTQIPLSIQKTWEKTAIYGCGGYALNSAPEELNFWFASVAWQQTLNDKWMVGGEILAAGATEQDQAGGTLVNFGGGYSFTDHLSLLFSIGHSIAGRSILVTYLGVSFFM